MRSYALDVAATQFKACKPNLVWNILRNIAFLIKGAFVIVHMKVLSQLFIFAMKQCSAC